MAQEGVTMDRLTEWIGEGEDRHAIPRMDLRKNGHQACCNKLAEYEDLEETGMISKWIPVKWHVILDAEREEEGIPDDIVYYLDCPMPEDGEEIIVRKIWENDIIKYHYGDYYAPVKFGEYQSCFDSTTTCHVGFYVDWDEKRDFRKDLGYWIKMVDAEVVGNIHDKSEQQKDQRSTIICRDFMKKGRE